MVTAPVRREVVREMVARGLSERGALRVLQMSATALRYVPAPDRNEALRARIIALAHRHRRYGAGMIFLKLRQAGERVNHKRVQHIERALDGTSGIRVLPYLTEAERTTLRTLLAETKADFAASLR